jgi:hypothetical protein
LPEKLDELGGCFCAVNAAYEELCKERCMCARRACQHHFQLGTNRH